MNFLKLIHTKNDSGFEKHIPNIEFVKSHDSQVKNVIKVTVGKNVKHPNTYEHSIKWIDLYLLTNDNSIKYIGRQLFEPLISNPIAKFNVENDMISDVKEFIAISYCNLHGLWMDEFVM